MKYGYGKEIEYYTIGVLTFYLLTGKFPFERRENEILETSKQKGVYIIQERIILSLEILNFITSLLNRSKKCLFNYDFLSKTPDQFNYVKCDKLELNKSKKYKFLKKHLNINDKNQKVNENEFIVFELNDSYFSI